MYLNNDKFNLNMVVKKRNVTMQVGFNFFDKIFEPSRRKVEKQLGLKVGQVAFTEMLAKNKVNLDIKLNKDIFANVVKKKGRKKFR